MSVEQPPPPEEPRPPTAGEQKEPKEAPLDPHVRFEKVPDNPLLTKKVLCSKPFTLYPLHFSSEGREYRQVPAVFHVLETKGDRLHVADERGADKGWIDKAREVYEWSTRLTWRPPLGSRSVKLFGSMDDATRSVDSLALEFDVQREHPVFPILEVQRNQDGSEYAKVAAPIGISAPKGVRFPAWTPLHYSEKGVLASRSEMNNLQGATHLFLTHMETMADPEERRSVAPLLTGAKLAVARVLAGQSFAKENPEEVLTAIEKTGARTRLLNTTVGDIASYNEKDFEGWLEETRFADSWLSRRIDLLASSNQEAVIHKWSVQDESEYDKRQFERYTVFGTGKGYGEWMFLPVSELP